MLAAILCGMRRGGIGRTVVGGASAAVALTTGVPAHAQAATTVRLSSIVAVKEPPNGEWVPTFTNSGFGKFTSNDPATSRASKGINKLAIPKLIAEAMRAQSANIQTITGATYTSKAFKRSLSSAILQLEQSGTATTVYGATEKVTDPQFTCPNGCPASERARYGVLELEVHGQ